MRPVLALISLLAATALAQETAIPVATYRGELERIETALRQSDLEGARALARSLAGRKVEFEQATFDADPSLLEPIVAAKDQPAAARQAAKIAVLLRELRRLPGLPRSSPTSDPALLGALRAAAEGKPLDKGGKVPPLPLRPLTVPERLRELVRSLGDWLADILSRIGEWLKRLWPERAKREATDPVGTGLAVAALVAAAIGIFAVLALRALRRRRRAKDEAASESLPVSTRDADPLSREASEWQRYARELAAAGRAREAIRAWYHAVLVALFRVGALHYQKGRTNWEYVSRAPEAAWRPAFVEITRSFDREWYGRDRSTADVLGECAGQARGILRSLGEGEA